MSEDGKEQDKERLSLRSSGRVSGGKTVGAGSVRQSFGRGRSKVVQVEVRKKRGSRKSSSRARHNKDSATGSHALTSEEQATRYRVLRAQEGREKERRTEKLKILSASEEQKRKEEAAKKEQERVQQQKEEDARQKEAEKLAASKKKATAEQQEFANKEASLEYSSVPVPGRVTLTPPQEKQRPLAERAVLPKNKQPSAPPPSPAGVKSHKGAAPSRTLRLKGDKFKDADEDKIRSRKGSGDNRKGRPNRRYEGGRRSSGRIDVQAAIDGDDVKTRSLASVRRQREREKRQAELERLRSDQVKVVREVVLPETITVKELANRMAAPQGEVVKALMKMGVMATANQSIDADTAELIVGEFGHKVRRVSDSDVEIGLAGAPDEEKDLKPRPPVVTIMGHVDHGKTTLLDALRSTRVAPSETGGITQHIGAYQLTLPSGGKITFLDTPGHEAFTAMRSRGASMTDEVILVVAADDGVMPQTEEAIKHIQAAKVPMIVAINKIDAPGADPDKVRRELLQYGVVVEKLGGDVQDVEISAKQKKGLDELLEAIMLQAEMLELRANPDRSADGAVIESRLDKGRGSVASLLVQRGTLHKTDIVVAGSEWGKIRALLDDMGQPITQATPSTPVEILGLSGVPEAGAHFAVVQSENRAREISTFRHRKQKEKQMATQVAARGTVDQMLQRIQSGSQKEVALVIKADVRGSAEALQAMVQKLSNDEVTVRVLNASVGQITESDVQLAKASNGVIIAFNVRATAQARMLAHREQVNIHYYSIIYQVSEDVERLVKGQMAPKHREKFLGYAEVRKVFNISKVGRVAGCVVTEGVVKRGCGVRLLRDNVVIHEGELSQLKHHKNDVKEMTKGHECGLSFAGYDNIQEGDVVECFALEEIAL